MTDDDARPPAEASVAKASVAKASVAPASVDTPSVQIIDAPRGRIHRLTDFINLAAALVGVVLVLLLGAYASGTTEGITSDVRGFASVLRRVLVAPVNVLEGILTFGVPAAVIFVLFLRREPRRIVESLGALAAGIIAALVAAETTRRWGSADLIHSLSITRDSLTDVTMPAYLAGLAAMLTTAGRRRSNQAVGGSWIALWAGLAIAIISSLVTVSAAFVTILIGRSIGLLARYALGSTNDRAYGALLVDAIHRAGFEVKRLARIDADSGFVPTGLDPVASALGHSRQGRIYELTTRANHHLLVVALDGDQLVADTLAKFWRTGRLRGLDTRTDLNLRHAAEGTVLVSHAARTAGVRTPRPLGMARSRDTMVTVYQRPTHCRPFADLAPGDVTDAMLDAIWAEILKAHKAGITHRAITSETVLIGEDEQTRAPEVWLTSWEMGEVASGVLSRRVDTVQMIALTATKVGAARAVAAAFRALDEAEVSASAPLLQAIVLPRATRLEAKARGAVLKDVRTEILGRLPEAPAAPENITRFGLRTALTIVLGLVAVYLVLTTFKADQVVTAIGEASPWWAASVFLWALVSFVGATLAMIAFSPVRLPVVRVFLAQVAASYVALVAPAGVGPAAINLRLLTRRNVPRPLAVATVALVQVSSIVVTVVGLFTISIIAGSGGTLARLPSKPVLTGLAIVAFVVTLAMVIPRVRTWLLARVMPPIRQTWPRLIQILGQPWRLALGLVGNFIMTAAYVAAFDAALQAFGYHPRIIDIAVVYLLGNTAGAIAPTPGGLGAIEVALVAALATVGIPKSIAPSIVVLFRAFTYWARIPLGYFAMRYMQAKKEI